MARGYELVLEVEENFPATSYGDAGMEIARVIQEALTNARRHSGARNVQVRLSKDGEELVAEVSDDGRGIEPESTSGGVGLRSRRQRAAALGGKVEIESQAGQETRVRLRVPQPQRSR